MGEGTRTPRTNAQVALLDARKAYVNAKPVRNLYVRLPYELGLGKGVVGKLVRCMYGTRDAGALWEWTYTQTLLKMGFAQGKSNPCCCFPLQVELGPRRPW